VQVQILYRLQQHTFPSITLPNWRCGGIEWRNWLKNSGTLGGALYCVNREVKKAVRCAPRRWSQSTFLANTYESWAQSWWLSEEREREKERS
jgi:hypothetical protein